MKFWSEVKVFIKLLQGTPEENHQKIVDAVQKQLEDFQKTGRPQW